MPTRRPYSWKKNNNSLLFDALSLVDEHSSNAAILDILSIVFILAFLWLLHSQGDKSRLATAHATVCSVKSGGRCFKPTKNPLLFPFSPTMLALALSLSMQPASEDKPLHSLSSTLLRHFCAPLQAGNVFCLSTKIRQQRFPAVMLKSALFPPKGLITVQSVAKGGPIAIFVENDSCLSLLLLQRRKFPFLTTSLVPFPHVDLRTCNYKLITCQPTLFLLSQ